MSGEPIEELMAALQRLGRMLSSRQVAASVTTAAGVEVSQQGAILLRVLLREGKQAIATLAGSASMDLAAVSRQVKALEDAGIIRRTRSAEDGRVGIVELTEEGRAQAGRIRAAGVSHLEVALRDWSGEDQLALATLMRRLVDDLLGTPVPPVESADAERQQASQA